MCDYSLLGIRNRLAEEGEELVVHRFPTGAMGLASPAELRPASADPGKGAPWARFWWALTCPFRPELNRTPCAVCIPPGARLRVTDVPERLRRQFKVSAEEEVTFVQLSASPYEYRDAIRFSNDQKVLLQRLESGQRVTVLSLESAEMSEEQRASRMTVEA